MTQPVESPQPKPITVVIEKMPEAPSKPLFADSTRLISIAAFLFSVATGMFATYQGWRSSRESIIDNVGKLIEQYYSGQEKLAKLDQTTQLAYVNLLRSQLRGTASRTVPQALRVSKDIDDGTWLALAQINDAENNLAVAEVAWRTAATNTNEAFVYTFAMRGLFGNLLRQNKLTEAQDAIDKAINGAISDKIEGTQIANTMPPHSRSMEKTVSHVFLVSQMSAPDCSILAPNYDAVVALLADVSRVSFPFDFIFQNQILYARMFLTTYSNKRNTCAPGLDKSLAQADFCSLIGNIVDNSLNGFSIYKGAADDTEARSRVFLPESEYCNIDNKGTFYCKYPDVDETSTKKRFDKLAAALSQCTNLPALQASASRETGARTVQQLTGRSADGAVINIQRSYWKPAEKRSTAQWELIVKIGTQP